MDPLLRCIPLTPEREQDYLRFFDSRAFTDNPKWAGCYCYFPIHDPARTEWRRRSAAENRSAVAQCIRDGSTSGLLAYQGDDVVGWCHAGPWSLYPMLHDTPEPDADTLGVIFCFVIAPDQRGKGIAKALLQAACRELRERGMSAVQAKPVRGAQGAAANHLGPLQMYLDAGFRIVREAADGDVFVRKPLRDDGGADIDATR